MGRSIRPPTAESIRSACLCPSTFAPCSPGTAHPPLCASSLGLFSPGGLQRHFQCLPGVTVPFETLREVVRCDGSHTRNDVLNVGAVGGDLFQIGAIRRPLATLVVDLRASLDAGGGGERILIHPEAGAFFPESFSDREHIFTSPLTMSTFVLILCSVTPLPRVSQHETYTIEAFQRVRSFTKAHGRVTNGPARTCDLHRLCARRQPFRRSLCTVDVPARIGPLGSRTRPIRAASTPERQEMNRFGMACPYCETWATVRTSEQLSLGARGLLPVPQFALRFHLEGAHRGSGRNLAFCPVTSQAGYSVAPVPFQHVPAACCSREVRSTPNEPRP